MQSPEQLEAMNANVESLANELENIMQENHQLSTTLQDITITPLTEDAQKLTSVLIQEVLRRQHASQICWVHLISYCSLE